MKRPQEYVELFHLLFIRHLTDRLDKSLYAIKGGCNLRFFFRSIRYSEDLDIDIKTIAKETLRNKISKLLESPTFRQTLMSRKIAIDKISEAKQTDTTQRWKLSLKLPHFSLPIPTKIEFSRRVMNEDFLFESIDQELITRYQLYPILTNHYTREIAFSQKVNALIHRTEVQARDVFDLHLLLNQGISPSSLTQSLKKEVHLAIENALSIDFSDFKAQVVAYLMEEYQSYYSSPQVWNDIQTKVISSLGKIQ